MRDLFTRTSSADEDEPVAGDTPGNDTSIRRRSFLMFAGAAAATLAGCGGSGSSAPRSVDVDAVSTFGYGGAAALVAPSANLEGDSLGEPNNAKGEATSINLGDEVSSYLDVADVDWYAFDATSGTDLHVEFSRASVTGVTAIILYGPDNDYLNLSYVGSDAPVTLAETLESDGTYYVEVADVQQGDGDYSLRVGSGSSTTTTTTTTETTATTTADPTTTTAETTATTTADPTTTTAETTATTTTTETTTTATDPAQSPYGGTARSIPGTVQAEDFDVGGEGVSYHDTTDGNEGGAYRQGTDVDIQQSDDSTDDTNVGWIKDGEWTEYTVDVTAGTYDVHVRLSSPRSGRRLRVELDGTNLGAVEVPNTGGWQSWQTVTLEGVSISTSGTAVLRLEALDSKFNVNWIRFEESSTTTTTTTADTTTTTDTTTTATTTADTTTTTATTTADTTDDDYGVQSYGTYGFGGVSS